MKYIILDKQISPYTVSTTGEVINQTTGITLYGSVDLNGYRYVRLSNQGKKYRFFVHRLVAEYFIPNPLQKQIVNHLDGDKANNNIDNLVWSTYAENSKHAYENNLTSRTRRTKQNYTEIEKTSSELWTPIKQNSNYSISSLGRVWSQKRKLILRPKLTTGYPMVTLSNQGITKDYAIHILVYTNFSDDYELEGYVIDHIDGQKTNCNFENLQKISVSENVKRAMYVNKTCSSLRSVAQYTLEGELVQIYPSIAEAGRATNTNPSYISQVCRGKFKQAKGYVYQYHNNQGSTTITESE